MSFHSKVIFQRQTDRHTHTHTPPNDYSRQPLNWSVMSTGGVGIAMTMKVTKIDARKSNLMPDQPYIEID